MKPKLLKPLLLFVALAGLSFIGMQQRKMPYVTLSQPEIVGISAQIDTVLYLVQRSDMLKQERNSSTDRLQLIQRYLIDKLNKASADSLKADSARVKK